MGSFHATPGSGAMTRGGVQMVDQPRGNNGMLGQRRVSSWRAYQVSSWPLTRPRREEESSQPEGNRRIAPALRLCGAGVSRTGHSCARTSTDV